MSAEGHTPRRALSSASACVAILLAAGLTAGPWRGAPVGPTSAARAAIPISVPVQTKSSSPPVPGYVYVDHYNDKQASTEIYGAISHPADGGMAQLDAQQFPAHAAVGSCAGSLIVRPAGATFTYQFQVTPTLATRCHVELLRNSGSTTRSQPHLAQWVHVSAHGPTPTSSTAALSRKSADRHLRPALSVG